VHDLQPGDLVFYNTLRRAFSHVGIYLGDNKFVHSPSSGGEVRIERMDVGYWKKRFNGARRVTAPNLHSAPILPVELH
jgi:cell wall-associated NlpC family hydrolase